MRRFLAGSAVALGILLFSVPAASAQWVEDPGTGWIHAALFRHETSSVYDETGSRKEIFNDGHATTISLFITGALGLFRGVDAWVQVPVHRLAFDDNLDDRLRTGIGDPRIFLRAGPELLGLNAIPVAVRGGVKFVGGYFPIDAEIIPLGEGQRDWEVMLEAGRSFFPAPLYVMGWIGYRWRETNVEADWKPGDETFGYAAVGGTLGPAQWKFAVEGWRGEPPLIQGLSISSARREMLQIFPTVGWPVGPGVVEAGLRVPLAGRNLPTGPALVLGYFARWPQ
ncbi:MAG: hypothetical protein WD205_06025 [Rhodothermales bacterium]